MPNLCCDMRHKSKTSRAHDMKAILKHLVIAAFAPAGLPESQCFAQDSAYFAENPPPGAEMQKTAGVLLDYGIGNKSGGFTIRNADGRTTEFYTAWPMHIAGRIVKCSIPPTEKIPADPRFCNDWPANVQLGNTLVSVLYWEDKYNGEPAKISNEINTLK